MALVKALEANTAAVLALVESNNEVKHQIFHLTVELSRFADCTAAPTAAFVPKVKSPIREAIDKKQEEKASAPSKAKTAPAAETPASTTAKPVATTSTSLTYDDIKAPFLELAKRDLAAAQALIAEFGFKTLKDAKPEQYGDILVKLNMMSEAGMA